MRSPALLDSWGRRAGYLRLSLTDRCNFNCVYCGDAERREFIPHEKVLRYEEMLRLAAIGVKMGLGKIRVTGGEPFVRKNCMDFLAKLRREFSDVLLSVTTNGSLLSPHINELSKLGLTSINISLDSFDRETFARLTRKDDLEEVLRNMDRLLELGENIKLNAVAMRGITDIQISDFVHAIKTMPVDLRFIEFMPLGSGTLWEEKLWLPTAEIAELFRERLDIKPVNGKKNTFAGPARMFEAAGCKGRVGFISPLSDHFCASCNRARVTSDGKLKLCLFGDKEYNIAPMLKRASDNAVCKALTNAWKAKPMGCDILRKRGGAAATNRQMAAIGG